MIPPISSIPPSHVRTIRLLIKLHLLNRNTKVTTITLINNYKIIKKGRKWIKLIGYSVRHTWIMKNHFSILMSLKIWQVPIRNHNQLWVSKQASTRWYRIKAWANEKRKRKKLIMQINQMLKKKVRTHFKVSLTTWTSNSRSNKKH